MRKTIIGIATLLLFPLLILAHGPAADFDDVSTGPEMMRFIEDRALGEELHEEMEGLMTKMMAGTMTENEAGRMAELMNQYPGPQGMMMSRMMGMNFGWDGGMMPWGGMFGWGGFWFWMITLTSLVWLAAGILLIAWLWKQIMKK